MAEDWTPERISTLMVLWGEGVSTSEIGRRLGVTKNAVVGKVHRLGLPKRNSPIKAEKAEAPSPTVVATAVHLARPAPARPSAETVQMDGLRPGMCRWPEGEPGTENFHFCGQPIVPEKPYCAYHCERAYVKSTKDKKSAVA